MMGGATSGAISANRGRPFHIAIIDLRQGGDVVAASLRFEARGRDGIEVQRAFSNRWRFREGLVASIQAYSGPNEAADSLP